MTSKDWKLPETTRWTLEVYLAHMFRNPEKTPIAVAIAASPLATDVIFGRLLEISRRWLDQIQVWKATVAMPKLTRRSVAELNGLIAQPAL